MTFYLANGLVSGIILAAFLALCDGLFFTSTFQVLIDVSYFPGLAGLPSIVELLIHLGISVAVASCYYFFYPPNARGMGKYLLFWVLLLSMLYLPLSYLSGQPLSIGGFLIWAIGHLLYILFLTFQAERFR